MKSKMDPLPIIIAVVLFVVLTVIAIVIAYFVRRHRLRQKQEASKKNFDDSIVAQHVDGSFTFTNRLSDLMNTPEPRHVNYTRQGNREAASIHSGYSNPSYIHPTELGEIHTEAEAKEQDKHVTVESVRYCNTSGLYDNNMVRNSENEAGQNNKSYPSLHDRNSHTYDEINDGYAEDETNTANKSKSLPESAKGKIEIPKNNSSDADNDFTRTLADQAEVPSPTDTIQRPNWPTK